MNKPTGVYVDDDMNLTSDIRMAVGYMGEDKIETIAKSPEYDSRTFTTKHPSIRDMIAEAVNPLIDQIADYKKEVNMLASVVKLSTGRHQAAEDRIEKLENLYIPDPFILKQLKCTCKGE